LKAGLAQSMITEVCKKLKTPENVSPAVRKWAQAWGDDCTVKEVSAVGPGKGKLVGKQTNNIKGEREE